MQRAAGCRDLAMQPRDERRFDYEFSSGGAADGFYGPVGDAKRDAFWLWRFVFENPHYREVLGGSAASAFFSHDEISSTAAGLILRSFKLPYSPTSPVTARVSR
jgi:hypothetical protein